MNKTKIEWCDSTWNPVTGCRRGCEYCYARRVAQRFGKKLPDRSDYSVWHNGLHCLVNKIDGNPYPYIFEPTLHVHRLDEPRHKTKPQTIFVCSMADLFGYWVPDEWIEDVFVACEKALQHRYLFLTKNPVRYVQLMKQGLLPYVRNMWYGASAVDEETLNRTSWILGELDAGYNTFISLEPLLGGINNTDWGWGHLRSTVSWLIVGAETGNRVEKIIPKKDWITTISKACSKHGIDLFMKNSLLSIVGKENVRRELPWKETSQ